MTSLDRDGWRAILQFVARSAAEDTDNRDGWCRWGVPDDNPWAFDAYKPLVDRGLLEARETWNDVLLRLTDAGWTALSTGRTAHHLAEEDWAA